MKKHLPGPRITEFSSQTSYTKFISMLKSMFFDDNTDGQFGIANSSGVPFDIISDQWHQADFVKTHGPPSKLKIYLVLFPVSTMLYN